jgi:hypothetical protein
MTISPVSVALDSSRSSAGRLSAPAGSSSTAGSNLSEQAAPTFRVLQGGGGLPPSGSPSFVLPPNGVGFLRIFTALEAIAVEHVYPAPIFSFSA